MLGYESLQIYVQKTLTLVTFDMLLQYTYNFQDGMPHRTKSHKFSQGHGPKWLFCFWKVGFWTRRFTWDVRFEMWLQSVKLYFLLRLTFLSYFFVQLSIIVVLFSYIQLFVSTPSIRRHAFLPMSNILWNFLIKSQVFKICFFQCSTLNLISILGFCRGVYDMI